MYDPDFYDQPAFSRSGRSCPYGKRETTLKTLVSDPVATQFAALCRGNRQTISERIRDLVERDVAAHESKQYRRRATDSMDGIGTARAPT